MAPKITMITADIMGQKRTMFELTRLTTGLSVAEAANLLNVSTETVQRWESGQTKPKKRAIRRLREIERFVIAHVQTIVNHIREEALEVGFLPEMVELSIPGTDEEARSRGFPTVSIARKCTSLITAAVDHHFPGVKVVTVRRGSTPISAHLVALQEAASSAV